MSSTTKTSIDTRVNELASKFSLLSTTEDYEKYITSLASKDVDPLSAFAAIGVLSDFKLHTAMRMLNSSMRDDIAFDPVRFGQVKKAVIKEVFGDINPIVWVCSGKQAFSAHLVEVPISEKTCQVIPRTSWFLLFSKMFVRKVVISVEPNMEKFCSLTGHTYTNGVLMVRKAAMELGEIIITKSDIPSDDVYTKDDKEFKCSTWAVELSQKKPFENDIEIARFFYGELEVDKLLEKETRPLLAGCLAFSMQIQFVT